MTEIPIIDNALGTPGYSITGQVPTRMKWLYRFPLPQKFVVLTDHCIQFARHVPIDRKIALLIEPSDAIDSAGLTHAKNLLPELSYVLSYDRDLVKEFGKKGLWYPIGGCWIPPEDRHIRSIKDRMVSIIASGKNLSAGHQIRHAAINALGKQVEVYGRDSRPIKFKTEALAPFRFSIVSENGKVDDYFTEKLIDCFLTGCVPIYYGCNTIGNYFNLDGMILFDTVDELKSVVSQLTPERYASMRHAIEDNFQRAQQYMVAEDWICEHYPFLFL